MKLPDVNEFVKHWPKSLSVLKEAVLTYFQKNNIQTDNVWFADIDMVIPRSLNGHQNIQVVLFGGFVERIFETGNWPDKNYTFWCLSLNVKKVLTSLLNIPENSVRVIPRYELFEKKEHLKKVLDLKSDFQIVYSGRLSSQKNIEMVLAFASLLQEQVEGKVELCLLGEWDNHTPRGRGLYKINSYQDHIEAFRKELSFKVDPVIVNHLGHHEWGSFVKPNSMMVNFSTFICEDFGVSIFQAQDLGIPMLLSKWGGHCDVEAENIKLVNVSDIGESLTSKEQIILKAQKVVNDFLGDKLASASGQSDDFSGSLVLLSLSDLQKIRIKNMEKYGHEMAMIGKDLMVPYSSCDAGKVFFRDYARVFSGAGK